MSLNVPSVPERHSCFMIEIVIMSTQKKICLITYSYMLPSSNNLIIFAQSLELIKK